MARLTEATDAELVHSFKQGDGRAFDELYRRHRRAVEAVCRRRLRDQGAVEECVQETFVRAHKALVGFDGGELVLHWLRMTAKCVAIDEIRRTARRNIVIDASFAPSTSDHTAHIDDVSELDSYLSQLPPRDASLLVAHHVHDLSVKALADAHGMTVGSMAVAIHRARTRLRTLVAEARRKVAALVPVSFISRIARPLSGKIPLAWPSWEAILATATSGLAVTSLVALVNVSEQPGHHAEQIKGSVSVTRVARSEDQSSDGLVPLHPEQASSRGGSLTYSDSRPVSTDAPQAGLVTQGRTYAVEVPGTNDRVTNESPPNDPDFSYGIRVDVGGRDVGFAMETWDEPEQRPMHELACDISRLGRPVSHCQEGSSHVPATRSRDIERRLDLVTRPFA